MNRKILIATTAHPRSDPRVAYKIARSLIEGDFEVDWLGPKKFELIRGFDSIGQGPVSLDGSDRTSRFLSWKLFFRALDACIDSYDWVYAPDPDAALLVLIAARNTQTRVWFDIHEDFHEASIKRWMGNQAGALAGPLLKQSIRRIAARSDLVTTVSPTLLHAYGSSDGGFLLPNTVSMFWPQDGASICEPPEPRVLTIYVGKPGQDRGTPALISALGIMQERRVAANVVLHASEKELAQVVKKPVNQELLSDLSSTQLSFVPLVAHAEMKRIISSSSLAMVGYTGPAAKASLPNRFFEALALGTPVLVPSDSPHMVDVVRRYNCGYTCDFTSPTSIADALSSIRLNTNELKMRSENARKAFLQEFTWEDHFDSVYSKLN